MKFLEIFLEAKDGTRKIEKLLVKSDGDEDLIVDSLGEDNIVHDLFYHEERVFDQIAEIHHEFKEGRVTKEEYQLVVGKIISEWEVVY